MKHLPRKLKYTVGIDKARREGGLRGACGKICHPSKHLAKSAMKALIGSGESVGDKGRLNVYYCDNCEAWHVGHVPKRGVPTIRP
jgi:hypothetical protein